MPRRKKIINLREIVPETPSIYDKSGMWISQSGEPTLIPLTRWENDRSLRGHYAVTCCDCGLEHFYSYEVFVGPDGDWWLNKRPYRLSPPKKVGRKPRRRSRK